MGSLINREGTGYSDTNGDEYFDDPTPPTMHQINREPSEIIETFQTKLIKFKWVLLGLLLNACSLGNLIALKSGIYFRMKEEDVNKAGPVAIFIIMTVSLYLTFRGFQDALAVYIGRKFAAKRGYSLMVIGFMLTPWYDKPIFARLLPIRSRGRNFIIRVSYIWIILCLNLIISPFVSLNVYTQTFDLTTVSNSASTTVNCSVYVQNATNEKRNYPTVASLSGVAELIFGTYMGNLTSEFPDQYNYTTLYIGPQPKIKLLDKTTITGTGFATNIKTICHCSEGLNSTNVKTVTDELNEPLTVPEIDQILTNFNVKATPGMVYHIGQTRTPREFNVTSIVTGVKVCGEAKQSFPVCVTRFYDHKKLSVSTTYMSPSAYGNGTQPAGDITIASENEAQNLEIELVKNSLKNILNGTDTDYLEVKSPVPGIMGPLFWWTTPNLLAVNPALLEGGIETFWAMILRGGFQRTLQVEDTSCSVSFEADLWISLYLTDIGYSIAAYTIAIQIIISLISVAAFLSWFRSSEPIGPCIRVLEDPSYFTIMFGISKISEIKLNSCMMSSSALWFESDTPVSIGEAIIGCEESVGKIIMDEPKLVKNLSRGRLYY